jgi:hypothetical protein
MLGRSIRTGALLALALAACGGDDDAGGEGNGSSQFGNAPPPGSIGLPGTGSGGSGSSGGNAGASAGGPIRNVCPDGQVRTTRATPRVMLVLDGSCSMSTPYPANGAPSAMQCTGDQGTRWAALRNALIAPGAGVVARLANVVEFGTVVYGTQNQCPIPGTPIDPALGNLAAIEGELPQQPPGMFTPTGLALDWVHDNMIEDAAPDAEFQPQIVVLATDGEPNSCDDWMNTTYQASVDAVTRIQARGVQTYVISLADATGAFHDHLQQLADIGSGVGSGILYEPTNPDQLTNDLNSLVGGAIGCDLTLNGEVLPGAECSGTVTLGTRTLQCNTDYVVKDSRSITLMGAACDELMTTPDTLLVADFPCDLFSVD